MSTYSVKNEADIEAEIFECIVIGKQQPVHEVFEELAVQ